MVGFRQHLQGKDYDYYHDELMSGSDGSEEVAVLRLPRYRNHQVRLKLGCIAGKQACVHPSI